MDHIGHRVRSIRGELFALEPLPAGHPFFDMANVVMTPVAAWNTADASERMIRQSVDNVLGFLAGTPVNVVNPDALLRARPTEGHA